MDSSIRVSFLVFVSQRICHIYLINALTSRTPRIYCQFSWCPVGPAGFCRSRSLMTALSAESRPLPPQSDHPPGATQFQKHRPSLFVCFVHSIAHCFFFLLYKCICPNNYIKCEWNGMCNGVILSCVQPKNLKLTITMFLDIC